MSQPLLVQNSQMDHTHNKLEVSIPNKQMGMMRSISSSPKSPSEISNKQMGLLEPMSNTNVLHNPSVLNMQIGEAERLPQYIMPNQHVGDMEGTWNNLGSQQMSLPSKRRTMGETMLSNSTGLQLSMPNKNVTHMEPYTHNLELPQLASPNKRTVSKSTTPGAQTFPATNKKMARNESISGKSGTKQLPLKNRTTQMEPSPKAKSASFESVRWKMRDSLASSLTLVAQGQDKSPNEESNYDNVSENPTDSLPSKETSSVDKINDVQITSQGILTNESSPDEDVSFADSFFVKDELLQGNGLAWAWDLDVDMGETKEGEHISKKPKLVNEEVEQEVRSPKKLAFKIEAELFKLFGGVNKKYREKGRSLLFNLKDHNNPELRERVLSGDIAPDRLCLMTPEDLASKELSQWRIAKAEELAQMVVLPDSDIDMRRLVKKTHKGEFQVEFERDDGVSVEVSVGTGTLTRVQTENKETDELNGKETGVGEKGSSKNQDISYRLSIPSDGTDLMQGLMVDEFRDAELLPPIVSLDEFMESLDAEPPFENLPVNGGKTISPSDKDSYEVDGGKMLPPSDKESSEGGYEGIYSDIATKEPVETMPVKSDKVELKYSVLDMKMKSNEAPIEQNLSPPGAPSNGDCVWEGLLQLNMSTLITVVGFFRSGEKISTKDWPISLEIKGRVRLDAFEKFVQGLPMSRSRAVMIVHFALKEGSSENDHSRLDEVVKSYVSDERLGFAEAAKGVEIYFCPPNPKLVEIITKNLSKHQSDNLNFTENGLVGMVVLRRAHLNPAMSPNSSHYSKHTAKREQFTSGKHQDKHTAGTNLDIPSKQTPLAAPTHVAAIDDDGDDDIPPGFGPARDEDDLPEFNFSTPPNSSLPNPSIRIPPHGSNSSAPPLDQIRELIQKYGQTENGVDSRNVVVMGIRPWDDEEDDDIPEWQPHAPPQQKLLPQKPPVHFGMTMARQPCPRQVPMPFQPPVNMVHGGEGWARQPSNFGTQPGGSRYYGGPAVRSGHTGMARRRGAARRK